jgi:hypothetical protein
MDIVSQTNESALELQLKWNQSMEEQQEAHKVVWKQRSMLGGCGTDVCVRTRIVVVVVAQTSADRQIGTS